MVAFQKSKTETPTFGDENLSKEQVKEDLENGIVNFITSIKSAMPEKSKSFEEFKIKLIGEANMSSITNEGADLLETVYTLIENDAPQTQIKENGLKPFAIAVKLILEHEGKGNNYSGTTFYFKNYYF